MKLVIAEKPSVGTSIAAVLGAKERHEGYMEGNGYLVSWCIGHLCDFVNADAYDEKYGKWRYDDLPIIPYPWRYQPDEKKSKQLDLLKMLFAREDVTEVINACDAGREGERIFRSVYYFADCNKPVRRLWISSMEEDAIRKGFEELKPGKEYDNLYEAAECRAKADWLVGINASRLFSVLYHRKLNVGRVMSPTLAMLAERKAEIDSFKSVPFYAVELNCGDFFANTERYGSKGRAEAVADACRGEQAIVTSVTKEDKIENAPKLYDLTTLQRDANRLLGYSAQQTMDYLQSLYEKRFCTYPRSDAKYLTDEMAQSIPAYLASAAKILDLPVPDTVYAEQVCNSSKVTDHHAIIPTASAKNLDMSVLPAGERELLKLIARRLFCAVSAAFDYWEITVTLTCGGTDFTAKCRVIRDSGWKAFLPKRRTEFTLPLVHAGDIFDNISTAIKEGKTTPPKYYTEDTLLAAMESAGATDMPDDAERKGLGTPATRSGIIEKLIRTGYVERKKAKRRTWLVPVNSGVALSAILPDELRSPALTAEWEDKLKQIENGRYTPEEFLCDIAEMVDSLVKHYQVISGEEVFFPSGKKVIGKCPRCGANVTEGKGGYFCERPTCKFAVWHDNRFLKAKRVDLTESMVSCLLENGRVLTQFYSENKDKTYDAFLLLNDDGERTRYSFEFPERKRNRPFG